MFDCNCFLMKHNGMSILSPRRVCSFWMAILYRLKIAKIDSPMNGHDDGRQFR